MLLEMKKLWQRFTEQFSGGDVSLGRSWTRADGFKFDPAPPVAKQRQPIDEE
jgi:hypothetical protein